MATKLYVGNLSWNTTDNSLYDAFSGYGKVLDSIVMRDRDTGRSRGFGFATMSTLDEANAAIAGLNDQDLDGRRIKVNLANPSQRAQRFLMAMVRGLFCVRPEREYEK